MNQRGTTSDFDPFQRSDFPRSTGFQPVSRTVDRPGARLGNDVTTPLFKLRKLLRPFAPSCATLLLLLTGCGYQQSGNYDAPAQSGYQWKSLYREDIQTVAVPIFTNKDFQRGIEFSLSKAVVNNLEAHTPYKVVPTERADTILEGEILSVRSSTLSRSRASNLPQDQILTVTVNFTWKDIRTGKVLVQRRNFQQTAPYFATLGEDRYTGTQEAVEKLSLGIVQELQAEW